MKRGLHVIQNSMEAAEILPPVQQYELLLGLIQI